MSQLRQLHLQLAFMGARALGKDVENQPCACQHPARQRALEIALLTRAQCMVENNELGLMGLAGPGDLIKLALTDKGSRMGR